MKNKLFFLILFCITTFCFGQKITLTGTVRQFTKPLSYANVIAKPKDVSKNLQFAITDNEGY